MRISRNSWRGALLSVVVVSIALHSAVQMGQPGTVTHAASGTAMTDPWAAAQTVQADDLIRELANQQEPPPVVLYVGVRALFNGGHIPNSSFHGTGSTEKGLAEIKAFAGTLPRTTNLVIYCGCCPLVRCPNIRPAYKTLQTLGFTKLRVLILPTSFAADWAGRGFPVEKSN